MGRRLVSDKVVSDDIVGTNGYHAPEVLFDDSYDIRADIFMLGITFCVMVGTTTACLIVISSSFSNYWTECYDIGSVLWIFLSQFFSALCASYETSMINFQMKSELLTLQFGWCIMLESVMWCGISLIHPLGRANILTYAVQSITN